MADNYLENRMEEYRSGRLASRSRTTSTMRAPRRADTLTLHYAPMTVAILADSLTPVVAETVCAFTAVGCRVAFTASDAKEGNAVAQRAGARYYPASFTPEAILSDFSGHCGRLTEVIVTFLASPLPFALDADTRLIDASRHLPQDTSNSDFSHFARHILYLAHPDNAFLLG